MIIIRTRNVNTLQNRSEIQRLVNVGLLGKDAVALFENKCVKAAKNTGIIHGYLIGSRNVILSPNGHNGNELSRVCPTMLGFLATDTAGGLNSLPSSSCLTRLQQQAALPGSGPAVSPQSESRIALQPQPLGCFFLVRLGRSTQLLHPKPLLVQSANCETKLTDASASRFVGLCANWKISRAR